MSWQQTSFIRADSKTFIQKVLWSLSCTRNVWWLWRIVRVIFESECALLEWNLVPLVMTLLWECYRATRSSSVNCAQVWTPPVISDSREATTTSMSASMTTWMYSALTMKIQCQKTRLNAMFCTWWTLMATAPVITPPKGSRGGSVIGRIPRMDRWSSRKSSSCSRPSH